MNLKEFFVGADQQKGNADGKLTMAEFGILISSVWGEGGATTLEKP
jgi:hypothetical protein